MPENSTILIALYAASLSTVLAAWTVYKDIRIFRDRGYLKIRVMLGAFWNPSRRPDAEVLRNCFPNLEIGAGTTVDYDQNLGQYLEVHVSNHGGHPIVLKSSGWMSYEHKRDHFRGNGTRPKKKWQTLFRKKGYVMPEIGENPRKLPKRLESGEQVEALYLGIWILKGGLYTFFIEDGIGRYFFANERDMKIAINGYPPNGGKWDHAAYEPSVFAKAIETARKESTAAAD